MFNGGFKEAVEQAATLPVDDPDAFDLFLEWIYTGRLSCLEFENIDAVYARIRLYGLAEKLMMPDLMDYTITTISVINRISPLSTQAMAIAYEVTGPDSPLRSFVARALYYATGNGESGRAAEVYKKNWPASGLAQIMSAQEEMISDLIDVMRNPEARKDLSCVDICEFHVHEGNICQFKDFC